MDEQEGCDAGRKRFSGKFKSKPALEAIKGQRTPAEIGRIDRVFPLKFFRLPVDSINVGRNGLDSFTPPPDMPARDIPAGDGFDIKGFIYDEDYVRGLIPAMERLDGFDVVNLANGKRYVLRDLLDTVVRLDGYANPRIEYDASKPTMIPKRLINPAKAKLLLGFEAVTPIETGLGRTIDWYRSTL